jgi:hypothetical protein
MSFPADFYARQIGSTALAALRARGPAKVFAAFARSCYVETRAGIACIGGPAIGRGPLNVIVENAGPMPNVGGIVKISTELAETWIPPAMPRLDRPPRFLTSALAKEWSANLSAQAFLDWLAHGARAPAARAANALIGLGPGLTPAGDDFVGGALIALRAAGHAAFADRVAAWALALAEEGTGKISRAHLRCAAAGEGHEALHALLANLGKQRQAIECSLAALARIGHSSGLDAAAGALLALDLLWPYFLISTTVPLPLTSPELE